MPVIYGVHCIYTANWGLMHDMYTQNCNFSTPARLYRENVNHFWNLCLNGVITYIKRCMFRENGFHCLYTCMMNILLWWIPVYTFRVKSNVTLSRCIHRLQCLFTSKFLWHNPLSRTPYKKKNKWNGQKNELSQLRIRERSISSLLNTDSVSSTKKI